MRSILVSEDNNRWVVHSHVVIENLDALKLDMATIESSSRGFVVTGTDSFLASFDPTVAECHRLHRGAQVVDRR